MKTTKKLYLLLLALITMGSSIQGMKKDEESIIIHQKDMQVLAANSPHRGPHKTEN